MVKSRIHNHWEIKLRTALTFLHSMPYFKPEFSSLAKPHPILWTAGSNPYEVSKAIVQCRMLSGRYRTEMLARHWSANKSGHCLTPTCTNIPEDLVHILITCPSYKEERVNLIKLWLSCKHTPLRQLLYTVLDMPESDIVQFILDPSVHPHVIFLVQSQGAEILRTHFHLTRTWCFTIHKVRAKLLGRWP